MSLIIVFYDLYNYITMFVLSDGINKHVIAHSIMINYRHGMCFRASSVFVLSILF
jgi:hypothetical protein